MNRVNTFVSSTPASLYSRIKRMIALAAVVIMTIGFMIPAIPAYAETRLTGTAYANKVTAFVKDDRFRNGASYGASQAPYIGEKNGKGCNAYARDFSRYVFNMDYDKGIQFNDPAEILPGDVVYVTGSPCHWIVILDRNGDSLWTAEGNWSGRVCVSWNAYSVRNGVFCRDGAKFRNFKFGYHCNKAFAQAADAVFDASFYSGAYADLKSAFGSNAAALRRHALISGLGEGRSIGYAFDPVYYLNNNPDLVRAYGRNYKQAYYHFITYGCWEGRAGSRFLDVKYYLARYSDLKSAFSSNYAEAIAHFKNFGVREGRQGSAQFSLDAYRSKNADLQKAFGNNNSLYYMHYIQFGIKEGRECT